MAATDKPYVRPYAEMNTSAFPRDDYTPYGYLDNPYDAGPWVGLQAGGVIRSLEACGFAWCQVLDGLLEQAGLRVGLAGQSARLLSPESFKAAGIRLGSPYHTSRIQTFDFTLDGMEVSLAFLLGGRDALLCRAVLRGLQSRVTVIAQGIVTRLPRRNARAVYLAEADAIALLVEPGPWYAVCASQVSMGQQILHDGHSIAGLEHIVGEAYSVEAGLLAGELGVMLQEGSDGEAEAWIAFGRGPTPGAAVESARTALEAGSARLNQLLIEDDRFWARAPRPTGDWPATWRRGWVYDLETTRLMVRPPAGVFAEMWPTWSLFRPRVVLAENALDMMRLAYADPETAQAALLGAFRSAPSPNVPCLFANGSLNMVADGGDACGTSPAWCLPFHNLYLLYLSTPDQAWLQALYPYLEAYLEWWIAQRQDAEGWFVYRCTWESGEDATPRLDPGRTGHGDIFHNVRPVELQAAMAHSALLMTLLAQELGLDETRWEKWQALYRTCVTRTRSMWDEAAGLFRDLYPADVPPAAGREGYWEGPADFSVLQLTPLMYGVATPEQMAALASRLSEFNGPPWTYWASWTYTVVEAARAAGAYTVAGRVAHRVLSSVYPTMDRRDQPDVGARPGTSSEWWPDDHSRTNVFNETYGWGATTATLLLRHVFGFGPGQETRHTVFELAPALHGDLLTPGRRIGFTNLHYREATFDLELEIDAQGMLTARLTPAAPTPIAVEGDEGQVSVGLVGASAVFQICNGRRYLVTIARGPV